MPWMSTHNTAIASTLHKKLKNTAHPKKVGFLCFGKLHIFITEYVMIYMASTIRKNTITLPTTTISVRQNHKTKCQQTKIY